MSNMSYCRFQNTLQDLKDCHENILDEELSDRESLARIDLVRLCEDIAEKYGDDTLMYLGKSNFDE